MAYETGEYMQKKYDEKGYTIKDKSLIIPLESVVYDRRRCRGAGKSSPPVLISQAKGQGRCSNGNMHAGSVFVFRAGFYIVPSCPGVRNFEGGSECECLTC